MKKVLSITIALIMILSLAACGSKKVDYSKYVGNYSDSITQRAVADVSLVENGEGVSILISWGAGAEEMYQWSMTATEKDGKLCYSDCEAVVIRFLESGDELSVIYSDGEGYFEYNEEAKTLSWTGSSEESCKECVFELN